MTSPSTSTSTSTSTNSCLLALGLLLCNSGLLLAANAESTELKLDVIRSIENDLEFDENQKLAKHYLVFPADRPDCPSSFFETGGMSVGYGHTAAKVEGDALTKVFPHYGTGESYLGRDDEDDDKDDDDDDYDGEFELVEEFDDDEDDNRCMAACLERGTDIRQAGHTMPHYHFAAPSNGLGVEEKKKFQNWFTDNCKRVEVCFINYAVKERPLQVYWISPNNGERSLTAEVGYSDQKTRCFNSFIGHKFEVEDEESGFFEEVTIEHLTTKSFGTSPPSSSQRFDGIDEVERNVENALTTEWSKHKMVPRTFSSLGFAKGRLPDDVFANMAAFYYNNRDNAVNEEWEGKGVFVNWWETDVKFVSIPWEIKTKWQLRLMELVSEWAGVEVEETSMYGLRQYETGARLLSHVDRLTTHAVSLIVNIAQDNLANPWPVEVFDHADRLHEITMETGEIVYYESAKNLHSRNRPLTCKIGGCRYINLFTHYRPVHDGDRWFTNLDDMPNRPPPLLEGHVAYDTKTSTCQRSESQDSNDTDNVLGLGTVQCDEHQLGTFVSPTLYKARNANDLFRWWKATADANFIGFDENNKETYARDDANGENGHYEDDNDDGSPVGNDEL